MRNVHFIYTLIVFTIFSSIGHTNACLSTQELFSNKAHDITSMLKEAYEDSNVYSPLLCYQNVRNFFFEYLNPFYAANDFKVLLIYKKDYAEAFPVAHQKVSHLIYPQHARNEAGYAQVQWRYHVVLVYRNQIIDLDYKEPTTVSKKEYLQNFSSIDLKDMVAIEIGGSRYLLSSHLDIHPQIALRQLRDSGQKRSLREYLEANESL